MTFAEHFLVEDFSHTTVCKFVPRDCSESADTNEAVVKGEHSSHVRREDNTTGGTPSSVPCARVIGLCVVVSIR